MSRRNSFRPQSQGSTTAGHSSHTPSSAGETASQFHQSFSQSLNDAAYAAAAPSQQFGGGNAFEQPVGFASTSEFHPHPALQRVASGEPSRHVSPYEPVASHELGRSYNGFSQTGMGPIDFDDKKKKGGGSTVTNDKELRELLVRNEGRQLKDVAVEVIQTERTPRAEKTKQLFAMLWLKGVCRTAKTSVPRSRVYSHYAERCGHERVQPLNPASFGKLVRVIFPGIQTRRLGVRGESKYHYVDLALDDGLPSTPDLERQPSRHGLTRQPSRQGSIHASMDFDSVPQLPADTSAFPSHEQPAEFASPLHHVSNENPVSKGGVFAEPNNPGIESSDGNPIMFDQDLKFVSAHNAPLNENDSIELPDIHRYTPPKTDIDTAKALAALYFTHCTSLIDCVRFCKEKQFFRLFTSFHGTLTVPVQKLLAHPALALWVQECDWLMYQKMLRFVSPVALQAAPPIVLQFLDKISNDVLDHIRKTFANQPAHVLEAKLKPATIFSSLLYRLLRVNATAHAAANLLTDPNNRDAMWSDWAIMVNPKRVIEAELPHCGYEEVYNILTKDVRRLLQPLGQSSWLDAGQGPFGSGADAAQTFRAAPPPKNTGPGTEDISAENVMDRWATFLMELPARFPQASTRKILHCINAVSSAALRDITMAGGNTYGLWWVTKCFVDEMSQWLAALGGFLDYKPGHSPDPGSLENSALQPFPPDEQDAFNMSTSSTAAVPQEQTTKMSADAPYSATGLNHNDDASSTRPNSQSTQVHDFRDYKTPSNKTSSRDMNNKNNIHESSAFGMSLSAQQSAPNPASHGLKHHPDEAGLDDSGIAMDAMDFPGSSNAFTFEMTTDGHFTNATSQLAG